MKRRYTVPCVGLVGFGLGVLIGSEVGVGPFAVGVTAALGAGVLLVLVNVAAGVVMVYDLRNGLERPGLGVRYTGQGR